MLSKLTKHSGHKTQGELGSKHGEEPRGSIEARADLKFLQVVVQISVIVMEKARQLVHLDLREEQNAFRCTHIIQYIQRLIKGIYRKKGTVTGEIRRK